MCKIIEFPQKKELPKYLRDQVYGAAKNYVDALYDALEYLDVDEYDYQGIDETNQMLAMIYAEALSKAIAEKEV
jgi:hypothetical protein